jgi:hypothetical protein
MHIICDGVVHNPLGGASYVFERDIIPYLLGNLKKNKLKISVGAQPNSSPHFGTLETIALSFALARKIEDYDPNKQVSILYEVIETAPSETIVIDGVKYQKSLQYTGKINKCFEEYIDILNYYMNKTNIDYEVRYQYEFNSQEETRNVFKSVLAEREYISKKLDQKHNNLRVRMSCPLCGLTDKNSVNNEYIKDTVTFYCPKHGKYSVSVNDDISKLEYNSPLRNLIRGMVYTAVNNNPVYDYEILRITGSDYAGFYQEELRYKLASYLGCEVHNMSMIFYAPLVLDWSGAKLSKSLYVKKGAYGDIPKKFINYSFLKEELGYNGIDILYSIVLNWINNPYMLFRHYSIYYFIEEFKKYE